MQKPLLVETATLGILSCLSQKARPSSSVLTLTGHRDPREEPNVCFIETNITSSGTAATALGLKVIKNARNNSRATATITPRLTTSLIETVIVGSHIGSRAERGPVVNGPIMRHAGRAGCDDHHAKITIAERDRVGIRQDQDLTRFSVTLPYLTCMPKSAFEPCIPTRGTKVPSCPERIHDIKHDGYRLIVQRDGKTVRLWTRNGFDRTIRP